MMKILNKFTNILSSFLAFSFVLISLKGVDIENASGTGIAVWSLITSIVFLFGLHNIIEFEKD